MCGKWIFSHGMFTPSTDEDQLSLLRLYLHNPCSIPDKPILLLKSMLFGGRFPKFEPFCVEDAFLVDALEGMGTEVISLGLQEVRR